MHFAAYYKKEPGSSVRTGCKLTKRICHGVMGLAIFYKWVIVPFIPPTQSTLKSLPVNGKN